jgi:hypothetical protein
MCSGIEHRPECITNSIAYLVTDGWKSALSAENAHTKVIIYGRQQL